MTTPRGDNPELYLLLEDYSERFQQQEGSSSSLNRDDSAEAASHSVPDPEDVELRLLVEDYPERAKRWVAEQAQTKTEKRPVPRISPAEEAPLQLLLADYDPGARFRAGLEGSVGTVPLRRAAAPVEPEGEEPDLLVDWERAGPIGRHKAGGLSVAIHLAAILLLWLQPRILPYGSLDLEAPEIRNTFTLLAPPPEELARLTQTAPNQGELTTEFTGPAEEARPLLVFPETAEETEPAVNEEPEPEEPAAPEPEIEEEPPAPEPEPAPPAEPEPPQIVEKKETPLPAAQSPNPGEVRPGTNLAHLNRPSELPAPKAPSSSKPKLTLEDPQASAPGREGPVELGSLKLNAPPGEVIQEAIREMAEGNTGRQAVGDGFGTGGLGGYLPPSPGNAGSALELLSDPRGIDFRPYLIQVLSAVRRNWYAVIPESARLGMSRGRVAIQFAIGRDGSVPKLVIATSSGVPSLDRAAVAGISASNPFPPLPSDYTGSDIRLQFAFMYNMKKSVVR